MMNPEKNTLPGSVQRPVLDEFESTASVDNRSESLSRAEFEMLAQLLRYPEQPLPRDSLKRVAGAEDSSLPDRKLDAWMRSLIRKTNALSPAFPLVRFVSPDSYIYSEIPPRRKPAGKQSVQQQ